MVFSLFGFMLLLVPMYQGVSSLRDGFLSRSFIRFEMPISRFPFVKISHAAPSSHVSRHLVRFEMVFSLEAVNPFRNGFLFGSH